MSLQATKSYMSLSTKAITNSSKCLYHPISKINRSQIGSRYLTKSALPIQSSTYAPPPAQIIIQRHPFSHSAALSKKKDKNKRSDDVDSSSSSGSGAGSAQSGAADPFDFSELHGGITDAMTRLKEDLQKLRSGGRFNPEVIEQLRVNLVKGSNETVRLVEVAQVVPKGGRAVAIIVGEEDVSFSLIIFRLFYLKIIFYILISLRSFYTATQASQLSNNFIQSLPNSSTRPAQSLTVKCTHSTTN